MESPDGFDRGEGQAGRGLFCEGISGDHETLDIESLFIIGVVGPQRELELHDVAEIKLIVAAV